MKEEWQRMVQFYMSVLFYALLFFLDINLLGVGIDCSANAIVRLSRQLTGKEVV